MQLRWLGTAGFEVMSEGGTTVLIDPFISRPADASPASPLGLADIPHADAILVTHGHFDHAFDVPALSSRLKAPVYASPSVCKTLALRGAPPGQLFPVSSGNLIEVGNLRIRALPAHHVHFDLRLTLHTLPRLVPQLKQLHRLLLDWPAGRVLGFHLIAPELRVVHLGSAGRMDRNLQDLRPDVALLPLQGHSDIIRITTHLATLLQPRLVVPHHWDDFYPPISQLIPPTSFAVTLSRALPATQLHIPNLGQWWVV